jgi:superfamily II DNA helicase RecQ
VLLSPEIAISPDFKREVLSHALFQDKLDLVAVDEAHVVSSWGECFRPCYSKLVDLRNLTRSTTTWMACSGTLDRDTLADVKNNCGFSDTVLLQRHSINRPDIYIEIRSTKHTLSSFKDLDFLIEPAEFRILEEAKRLTLDKLRKLLGSKSNTEYQEVSREYGKGIYDATDIDEKEACFQIKKTIVYFDSISTLEKALLAQRLALMLVGCSRERAELTVVAYHSELAEDDKKRITDEFTKPDGLNIAYCSQHRIIYATDAMGMGVDNPDVAVVVQWKIPSGLSALWQRAGRAARAPDRRGRLIWLLPPSAF